MEEAEILIENWRNDYNRISPHSALGYQPPAPEAFQTSLLAAPLFATSTLT
jgi:putative transposase